MQHNEDGEIGNVVSKTRILTVGIVLYIAGERRESSSSAHIPLSAQTANREREEAQSWSNSVKTLLDRSANGLDPFLTGSPHPHTL